jgi:hypothetical protein
MGVRGCDRVHQRSGGTRSTFDLSMASMCPTAKCRITKTNASMTVFVSPASWLQIFRPRTRPKSGEPQERERAVALAAIRPDPNFASALPPTSLRLSWSFNTHFLHVGTFEIMSLLTSCPFDVLGDKHNILRRILRACTAPSRVTSRRQQS